MRLSFLQTLPPLHHHGVRRGGETYQVVCDGVQDVDRHVLQHHLLTAATDSQASDSCLAELSFLIFAGVLREVWLLLSSHSWFRTSLALSLFLASLTSSLLMRSLAGPDTLLHSLGCNSNFPCW